MTICTGFESSLSGNKIVTYRCLTAMNGEALTETIEKTLARSKGYQ
jgi:hypothetical protein